MTLCIVIALSGFGAFLLVRNEVVYRIRVNFICDSDLWPYYYKRLPSHDRMVIDPRQWHRWTMRQYAEQSKVVAA